MFLRFSAEEKERKRSDAGVRTVPSAERAVAGELLGDNHGGCEIELHAAVAFGSEDGFEAQGRGFAQERDGDIEIPVLHFVDVGPDLFFEEFARGAGDVEVLGSEIFGSEDVVRRLVFDEEEAADGFCDGCG